MESQETGTMLKQAAVLVRQLTHERDEALAALSGRNTRDRAEKVASMLVQGGYLSDEERDDKVAALVAGGEEGLAITEKAVEITSAPEGVAKLASVGAAPAGDALSQFEQYIMNHGQVSDVPTDYEPVA